MSIWIEDRYGLMEVRCGCVEARDNIIHEDEVDAEE